MEQAIKVRTLDGLYSTFEQKKKGSITAGKLADFAVLRKDLRKVNPDTNIVVDSTYIGTYIGGRASVARRRHEIVRNMILPDRFYGNGNLRIWRTTANRRFCD